MPVAKVYVPEGTLTPDQRREIVKGIHDVINSVEKRPPEGQTYVLINEVPSDIGVTPAPSTCLGPSESSSGIRLHRTVPPKFAASRTVVQDQSGRNANIIPVRLCHGYDRWFEQGDGIARKR